MKSQNADILAHLKTGKPITFWEAAYEYGVMHLPRRILDLKEMGHDIQSEYHKRNGKRFKKYWLVKDAPHG